MTPSAPRRYVDMRVSLTWLLSAATSVMMTLGFTLWNIAGQSNKLDQLLVTNTKMEKRLDDRDARIDLLRDKLNSLERTSDNAILRLDNLERSRK